MTTQDDAFDVERYLDASAAALGLSIAPAYREGVIRFLNIAHGMAQRISAAPIDTDEIEPAPVFTPGSHDDGTNV